MTALAPERAAVLGCEIDRVRMSDAVARCDEFVRERTGARYMAVNASKVVLMRRDPELRRAGDCELVTADGQAVVWASRLLGDPLPERVAGIDLMCELLSLAERRGYRVYLLGARADVLERAVERIRERHPRLRLAGRHHGYLSAEDEPAVVAAVRAAAPDLLFVGMPSPRKERFLSRWGGELDVPFAMGVGGSIDVLAGLTRRAPWIWQRLGMEWAYRLIQEPRRLFGRYLSTNCAFLAMTAGELWRRRRRR
ncbi:MAG TPA: WecB/TagA/CpsF family glycosyltransferase [Solirubrobacteraceae bacterium]